MTHDAQTAFHFDVPHDRRNTYSQKWMNLPTTDSIAMCLADMDFQAPQAVTDAFAARVAHGIYGYTHYPDGLTQHITAWVQRRYAWSVAEEWIAMNVGVVASLCTIIRALTQEGDRVIIQTPVYAPFFTSIRNNQRVVVENQLILEDGHYQMDFDTLEAQARDAKLLILCNPHNPVGRVWTRAELSRVGEICLAHGVTIVSDDIHCDFALSRPYQALAALVVAFAQQRITCLAASKTFNIAGLDTSYEIIPNPDLREKIAREKAGRGISKPNMFGLLALEQVYQHGDAWLEALCAYLRASHAVLHAHLDPLEQVRCTTPEGTYLAWLDCRAYGRTSRELCDYLLQTARVRLTPGRIFGATGEGFLRLNYGTDHTTLRTGLERIAEAFFALAPA